MIRSRCTRLFSCLINQQRSLFHITATTSTVVLHSYDRNTSNETSPLLITATAAVSILGLFKRHNESEDEEEEGKLPISFKRQYVMAQMNVTDQKYQAAEINYHKALEILQKSPLVVTQPYIEAMAVITYELGELYVVNEDWDRATSNYVETINLMSKCGLSMEDPAIIELSLKLGKTFTNKKDYQEAEKTFNFTLSSAKKLVETESTPDNLALLGMCYHVKAQFHLMMKEFKQALTCFTHALDTAKLVYGNNDIQIAVLMNDCSTALEGLSQFDEAAKYLQDAIDLFLSLPDPHDNEHLATLLMNLGAIKNNQSLKEDSIKIYTKALSYAVLLTDKSIHKEIRRRLKTLTTKN